MFTKTIVCQWENMVSHQCNLNNLLHGNRFTSQVYSDDSIQTARDGQWVLGSRKRKDAGYTGFWFLFYLRVIMTSCFAILNSLAKFAAFTNISTIQYKQWVSNNGVHIVRPKEKDFRSKMCGLRPNFFPYLWITSIIWRASSTITKSMLFSVYTCTVDWIL